MSMESIIRAIIDGAGQETAQMIEQDAIPSCEFAQSEPAQPRDSRTFADFDGDYVVGYKMRVSGLSERSWGNGQDRRTVYHAIAIKLLDQGRLKRNPRQFLCSTEKPSFGVSSAVGFSISCDRCREIIERYSLISCDDGAIERLIDCY